MGIPGNRNPSDNSVHCNFEKWFSCAVISVFLVPDTAICVCRILAGKSGVLYFVGLAFPGRISREAQNLTSALLSTAPAFFPCAMTCIGQMSAHAPQLVHLS